MDLTLEQAIENDLASVSAAFHAFLKEAPIHAQAWTSAERALDAASALDAKTKALASLAVLAALRLTSGVGFHVAEAVKAGATRDEIVSAILVGLPAAGLGPTLALPETIEALRRAGRTQDDHS
jgi:AhpD family alkylhydroperoxidase